MAKSKVVTRSDLMARGWEEKSPGSWVKLNQPGPPCVQTSEQLGLPKKRIRQDSKPLLNKLETEFLDHLKYNLEGRVQHILIQSLRFKLGNGIWYKPDFVRIRETDPWLAVEVKGPKSFRGGFENLKVAASKYPLLQWVLVWKDDRGNWTSQYVLP